MEQFNSPKISVIVPIYNVEPYLRQCLDSVVNQTYHNLEIILIDDGSPDNCGAICDEYAEKDDRITVIHKENGGLSAARNDGMARATGKWITFVDSDDWCEATYYEQLILAMGNNEVDVFCAGGYYREEAEKSVSTTLNMHILKNNNKNMNELIAGVLVPYCGSLKNIGCTGLGGPWDKLYRADFLMKYRLKYNTENRAWEDILFNLQVFDKAEKVGGCLYIGYHYRILATSIMRGFNPQKPVENYNLIVQLHAYLKHRDSDDMIQQAIKVRSITVINNAMHVYYFHPANTKPYKETADEIKKMKMLPYFREAIYSENNQFFTKKQIILKYLLRLPWVWPIKMAYQTKQKMKVKQ